MVNSLGSCPKDASSNLAAAFMDPLFYLLSTGSWVSGAMVLRSKNPVHSVFYLVLVFLHASGLLCLLGLEFFALLQLLVYVGALAIMFLFVVMLLDIPATEILAHQRGTYPVAGLLMVVLLASVALAMIQPFDDSNLVTPLVSLKLSEETHTAWQSLAMSTSHLAQLGVALYGVHVDLLILASLLLLVAMIGAVVLTLKRRVQAPMHDIFSQHNRDFQKIVYQIRESFFLFLWLGQCSSMVEQWAHNPKVEGSIPSVANLEDVPQYLGL